MIFPVSINSLSFASQILFGGPSDSQKNLKSLLNLSEKKYHHKIKLFLEFCEEENNWNNEVIDPYYLNNAAFEEVFSKIEKAVKKLLKKI